jgi:8-amino-7-oxononanoate synthase
LEPLESKQGSEVRIAGQPLINFSSNDYLGLAAEPRVVDAAARALAEWGMGAGASRLVVGDFTPHQRLEAQLAQFEGTEAARLFNSGYAANLSLIATLVGPEDAIFSDALNHASIVDGCRLSRARVVVYPHADPDALSRSLEQTAAVRKLVVTDSVFSMDGDIAPLPALVDTCARHGAALLVDEAHATGVLGARGAGACEAVGVEDRVDVRMGTLSKALGCVGAYAACARPLADLLVSRARSFVFSTALPPALGAAASQALSLLQSEPERRERLWHLVRHFAAGLQRLGFPAEARSAIFPIVLGSPERAVAASTYLRQQGLLVRAIRPPTVPEGTARLRFALTAAHTEAHLEFALHALARL